MSRKKFKTFQIVKPLFERELNAHLLFLIILSFYILRYILDLNLTQVRLHLYYLYNYNLLNYHYYYL